MKKMLHRLFAPIAALLALAPTASAAKAPQVAARPLGGLRCRHDHLSLRDDPPPPGEHSVAHTEDRPAVGSSQQLVVETIVDEKNPMKLMQALSRLAFSPGLPPLAARVPPAEAGGARRRGHEERVSAAGARPDGDLGGGVHPARQSVPRHGPEGRRRREDDAAQHLRTAGQADRRAREQHRTARLLRHSCPKARSAQLLEGAIDQTERHARAISTQCSAPGRSGDVNAIAAELQPRPCRLARARQALLKRRNANWSRGSSSAWRARARS